MTETYDFEKMDEKRETTGIQISVTPAPPEEASRFGMATVRGWTKTGVTHGRDVLHPVMVILRGLRREAGWVLAWWRRSSKERRKLALAVVAMLMLVIVTLPHGLWILAGLLMASAALVGRVPRGPSETPQQTAKLQTIYNGLVPFLMDDHDPAQSFQPGGDFKKAFDAWCFNEFGQLIKLELHYSPFFTDGEPEARAKVERAIERKAGQANHYMYEWNEEKNLLAVAIVPSAAGLAPPETFEAPTGKARGA